MVQLYLPRGELTHNVHVYISHLQNIYIYIISIIIFHINSKHFKNKIIPRGYLSILTLRAAAKNAHTAPHREDTRAALLPRPERWGVVCVSECVRGVVCVCE